MIRYFLEAAGMTILASLLASAIFTAQERTAARSEQRACLSAGLLPDQGGDLEMQEREDACSKLLQHRQMIGR
jgi:hypothetical protein